MENFKKIKSKNDIDKDDKVKGYIIDANEKVCRSIIDSLKGRDVEIAVIGGDNYFNRRAIETLKINYLISPERGYKKDTLKQRDSGMNHVLAKEAARKGIKIVIDIDEVKKLKSIEKVGRISRIIQNIKICRRAKCEIGLVSFDDDFDKKQIMAIGFSFGMNSGEAKNSYKFQ